MLEQMGAMRAPGKQLWLTLALEMKKKENASGYKVRC